MEAQLKARTFASVRTQFAFKTIDQALVADADKWIRPMRPSIVLFGSVASVVAAALIAWLLDRITPKKTNVPA